MASASVLSFVVPVRLEYMSWWAALALFTGMGAFVVLLGMRSLNGLGTHRKWAAIGIRLTVLLLIVLILAGIRYQHEHEDMEVWVLRDVSGSTELVEKKDYPGNSLQESIDDYLRTAAKDPKKKPADTIGVISFQDSPQVDAVPSSELKLDTRTIRDRGGNGTDLSAAIELAMASMSPDKLHRFVLIHDGNSTTGDTDNAIAAAASQHVPIDVMPLHYDVQNAVLVERFISPTWKRENEPFTIDVILRSTGSKPVSGKLDVVHKTSGVNGDRYLEHEKPVTLVPGLNVVHVMVPALANPGVHRFVAVFKPDAGALAAGGTVSADVDKINQPAEALTFVRGQGQVLFVDNYRDAGGNKGPGQRLEMALKNPQAADGRAVNKINVRTIDVEHFPQNLVELQNYDAVILGNVSRGSGGLSTDQDKMLAQYVHDMGGGVVMLGGDETFGAGAWQNSEMEKVLPVDMDIPAQRRVGKGALVLVMHSCEMPDGNGWGLECALQAIKTLSEHDEVGICSFDWHGGGAAWDYPLQEKGDGSAVIAAAKKMALGDMPSFDDAMNVALNGTKGGGPAGSTGLAKSNARHKHVIIISDGDPQAPNQALVQAYKDAKVSVSTVTVYPHSGGPNSVLPPVMEDIATQLKGRAYGPINSKPSQLPQIFIKEATIVRRSLLHENPDGMPVKLLDASDPAAAAFRGIEPPPIFGLVLTTKKNDPKVSMPMAVGKMIDPVLADWQAGLGKTIVFTSDPTAKWGAAWVGSPQYDAFWGNVVRSVERPPMSEDFEVRTTVDGAKGKIAVEAVNKDDNFLNFLSIGGDVLGPNGDVLPVHLVQTGPGNYEATFDASTPGSYAVALSYHGQKQKGYLRGGVAVNTEPEYRDLKSNDGKLDEIRGKTAGRMLNPWDGQSADLFSRDNVPVTASPMPIWDRLVPLLLALILLDVATRRIAWDWASIRRAAVTTGNYVKSFTSVQKVESRHSLDALRQIRQDSAEGRARPGDGSPQTDPRAPRGDRGFDVKPPAIPSARPDPKAKFQAKTQVEGDISQLVGGASDKPIPAAPKKPEPKGAGPQGSHTGSLLEAKRRAQEQIKKKEEDGK